MLKYIFTYEICKFEVYHISLSEIMSNREKRFIYIIVNKYFGSLLR